VLESQISYWKQQLAGAPAVLELPLDHPRPPVQTHGGAHHSFVLDGELARGLKELSRREGVTLFMTLLAAWQVLLARYSGQDDIVVGTTIANRTRGETEALIGFFVNTLALRGDMRGDPTVRELLQQVREVSLGAYAHQDLPFEKLVEELRPERSLSHSPLFQVMFGLENVPMEDLELPGLTLHGGEDQEAKAKFDLSLATQETGDSIGCLLTYNTDLFEATTISRMQGHFETLLHSMVAQPGGRLSMLKMLTEEEDQEQEIRRKEREDSEIKQLRGIRRKRVSASRVEVVKTEPPLADEVTLVSNQSSS
jgi:non-ribosomal peptide synthetase component F